MNKALSRFAAAATDYCTWCATPPDSPAADARRALHHLSTLALLVLDLRLPDDTDPEIDGDDVDEAVWSAVYTRCSTLPVSYYGTVCNPLIVPAEPASLGDLGDDIADIHRDLARGLSLFRAGHLVEAEWEWRFSFQIHWGRHLSSALDVLYCWLTEADEW